MTAILNIVGMLIRTFAANFFRFNLSIRANHSICPNCRHIAHSSHLVQIAPSDIPCIHRLEDNFFDPVMTTVGFFEMFKKMTGVPALTGVLILR